jgi:hypothetical protein
MKPYKPEWQDMDTPWKSYLHVIHAMWLTENTINVGVYLYMNLYTNQIRIYTKSLEIAMF